MLVVCCGMPRSGSTLQYQIVCELIERAGLGHRPATWPSPIEPAMASGPRPIHVAKVHDPDPRLATLDPRFTRHVYVYRDVRDAIASHLQKHRAAGRPDIPPEELGALVRRTMLAPFDHFAAIPGILVSRYERMIEDVPGEVRRIGAYLGVPAEGAAAEGIAAGLGLAAQRRYLDARDWRPGEVWDGRTLLHRHHISDGRVGKFREVLSAEQLREVERVAGAWLRRAGYHAAGAQARPAGAAHAFRSRV